MTAVHVLNFDVLCLVHGHGADRASPMLFELADRCTSFQAIEWAVSFLGPCAGDTAWCNSTVNTSIDGYLPPFIHRIPLTPFDIAYTSGFV